MTIQLDSFRNVAETSNHRQVVLNRAEPNEAEGVTTRGKFASWVVRTFKPEQARQEQQAVTQAFVRAVETALVPAPRDTHLSPAASQDYTAIMRDAVRSLRWQLNEQLSGQQALTTSDIQLALAFVSQKQQQVLATLTHPKGPISEQEKMELRDAVKDQHRAEAKVDGTLQAVKDLARAHRADPAHGAEFDQLFRWAAREQEVLLEPRRELQCFGLNHVSRSVRDGQAFLDKFNTDGALQASLSPDERKAVRQLLELGRSVIPHRFGDATSAVQLEFVQNSGWASTTREATTETLAGHESALRQHCQSALSGLIRLAVSQPDQAKSLQAHIAELTALSAGLLSAKDLPDQRARLRSEVDDMRPATEMIEAGAREAANLGLVELTEVFVQWRGALDEAQRCVRPPHAGGTPPATPEWLRSEPARASAVAHTKAAIAAADAQRLGGNAGRLGTEPSGSASVSVRIAERTPMELGDLPQDIQQATSELAQALQAMQQMFEQRHAAGLHKHTELTDKYANFVQTALNQLASAQYQAPAEDRLHNALATLATQRESLRQDVENQLHKDSSSSLPALQQLLEAIDRSALALGEAIDASPLARPTPAPSTLEGPVRLGDLPGSHQAAKQELGEALTQMQHMLAKFDHRELRGKYKSTVDAALQSLRAPGHDRTQLQDALKALNVRHGELMMDIEARSKKTESGSLPALRQLLNAMGRAQLNLEQA